jgi:excinuclease UvrABC helicase subunit UvrB
MNTRARTAMILRENPEQGILKALEHFDEGIGKIMAFYNEYGLTAEIESSVELSILKALKTEFLKKSPPTLEEELKRAIDEERFEDAAAIRDRIRKERGKKEAN